MILKTKRLLLVSAGLQHVDEVYRLIKEDNRELSRWTTISYPITKKKIRDYYRSCKKEQQPQFSILDKKTKQLLGKIGLRRNKQNNSVNIGYWIAKTFRNNGYVTEAAKAVIDYAFQKLNAVRVEINARKDNKRSRRVIEKLGLHYEGTLRQACCNGFKEYEDLCVYSMLRKEWG